MALIELPDAKAHLRVAGDDDDGIIAGYVDAAQGWVEDFTGLYLTRRQVTESAAGFTRLARLMAWPIADDEPVTVTYRDAAGNSQAITGATLRATSRPAYIYPTLATNWPADTGTVDVTFTAGFASAGEVPPQLRQAVLLLLTAFYEDREGGEMLERAQAAAGRLCRRWKRRVL